MRTRIRVDGAVLVGWASVLFVACSLHVPLQAYANTEDVDANIESVAALEEETESVVEQVSVPLVSEEVPTPAQEAHFTVTPVVTNEKAKPRDIIKKELVVTNTTNGRIDLYITVENIDPNGGPQEFVSPSTADLTRSLANWIEVTRGVIELDAGESRKIPYLIHVNLTAAPGSYYARIGFTEGPRRKNLTPQEIQNIPGLMLNVEVLDNAKERLQLGNFLSDASVVFDDDISFSYLLENTGNRDLEPRGTIRIFNRRGEEVGSVPLNADGTELAPDQKQQLAALWSTTGRFGKYKAYLDLEYGENQTASVQDTTYFWVFPWKEIIASIFGVFILALFGTWVVHLRAVAQPVRARAQREQAVPRVATQTMAPVRPAYARAAVAPVRTTLQRTSVHGSVQSERRISNAVSLQAPQQGPTVLQPRGNGGGAQMRGGTIELAPRRR